MSTTSEYLKNVKAELASRAAVRASIKPGDMVTVSGVEGTYRVSNMWHAGNGVWAYKQKDGKDWQGSKGFALSRCNKV